MVLVLAAAGGIGYRIWRGDQVRAPWCRVLPCADLDGYDALCRVAAFAEFSTFDTEAERDTFIRSELESEPAGDRARSILDENAALPNEARYPALERGARESGAPTWTCPPLSRVLTSTAARSSA